MTGHEVKSMSATTEIRKFDRAKIELVNIAGTTVARSVLQKGWKWSQDIKPVSRPNGAMPLAFSI
jgi:hypothetical protein